MSEVDKWADEVSAVCKKYGTDFILCFDVTEDGCDFHGFVAIKEEESSDELWR
jgi:hypothetical protein